MIPKTLNEWSSDSIMNMLRSGCFEGDEFDFKERLSHKNAPAGLKADCCAFANSNGGFLVFGVKDDKTLSPEDRMVGIPADEDFYRSFGDQIAQCNPSINWDKKETPISLPNGNLIHVVFVPRSWKAPHTYGEKEKGFKFYKRTNKGNDFMSVEEVRSSFLNFYEKRIRLQLLLAELENIKSLAHKVIQNSPLDGTFYSLTTFDISIIEAVIADSYPVMAERKSLYVSLTELRNIVRIFNKKNSDFSPVIFGSYAPEDKGKLHKEHNIFVSNIADKIWREAERSSQELKILLDL